MTNLAQTPPLGWNSRDAYGPSVREDEVRAHADYVARHLLSFGWDTVVIGIQWYAPTAKVHGYIADPHNVVLDEWGRLVPDPLPSAANGAGRLIHPARLACAWGGLSVPQPPLPSVKRLIPARQARCAAAQTPSVLAMCRSNHVARSRGD